MNLHYDKKTGRANEVVEKELSNSYRIAIEKVAEYLLLELFKYNRISMEEVPNDVFNKAHKFIGNIRADFINNTLMYYYSHYYITSVDYKRIFKSFNESIAQAVNPLCYNNVLFYSFNEFK